MKILSANTYSHLDINTPKTKELLISFTFKVNFSNINILDDFELTNILHLYSIKTKDKFIYELKNILLNLSKTYIYKIEYSMFVYKRNINKKLVIYSGACDCNFECCKDRINQFIMGHIMLEDIYNKEYYCYNNNFYDKDTFTHINTYIYNIYNIIHEDIIKTNKDIDINKFIVYKKELIVQITKKDRSLNY